MKNTIILAISILVLGSCTKDEYKFGDQEAEVQIIVDEYEGDVIFPESISVFLKKKGESNYLYEKITDENGKVKFDLLHEGQEYVVNTSCVINNVTYADSLMLTIDEDDDENIFSLRLSYDSTTFNLVKITCVDSQYAPLPQVDVCLFLSSFLADSADCAASIYSGVSGNDGVINFWNSNEGPYYIGIRDTVGGFPVLHKDSLIIPTAGKIEKTLILIP